MVLASSRWWFIRLGSISSGWTGSGIASSWFVEVLQIVIIIMMIIGSVIVGRMCQYLYLYRVFHYKRWNSGIHKKSSENENKRFQNFVIEHPVLLMVLCIGRYIYIFVNCLFHLLAKWWSMKLIKEQFLSNILCLYILHSIHRYYTFHCFIWLS